MIADSFSRRPDMAMISAISSIKIKSPDLTEAYNGDKDFDEIYVSLTTTEGKNDLATTTRTKRYELRNGLLHYEGRLCIPRGKDYRYQLMKEAHDTLTAGHLGVDKTYMALCKSFYWPRMDKDVKKYVSSCDVCQRNKPTNTQAKGLLNSLPSPSRPWEAIAIVRLWRPEGVNFFRGLLC